MRSQLELSSNRKDIYIAALYALELVSNQINLTYGNLTKNIGKGFCIALCMNSSYNELNDKLSLCLINEALFYDDVWGTGVITPPLLISRSVEVNDQLHAAAAPIPIGWEVRGAQQQGWTV
jgi:hypothetical protein